MKWLEWTEWNNAGGGGEVLTHIACTCWVIYGTDATCGKQQFYVPVGIFLGVLESHIWNTFASTPRYTALVCFCRKKSTQKRGDEFAVELAGDTVRAMINGAPLCLHMAP